MDILDGCLDVDLQATPRTNTLRIRRLAPETGESRVIRAAYVSVPALEVSAIDQRYTRLAKPGPRTRYRYEAGSFRRDLVVDADDVVTDYPRLWRRLRPPGRQSDPDRPESAALPLEHAHDPCGFLALS